MADGEKKSASADASRTAQEARWARMTPAQRAEAQRRLDERMRLLLEAAQNRPTK